MPPPFPLYHIYAKSHSRFYSAATFYFQRVFNYFSCPSRCVHSIRGHTVLSIYARFHGKPLLTDKVSMIPLFHHGVHEFSVLTDNCRHFHYNTVQICALIRIPLFLLTSIRCNKFYNSLYCLEQFLQLLQEFFC